MRFWLLILGILITLPARAAGLVVIASPDVPVDKISVSEMAAIYTLRKTVWGNNAPVVPVNREANSALREKFSEAVFNLSPQELAEYWNQLRFKGKQPPLVQTSDQAVLGFVRSVPGAIGYVDGSQAMTGVKVLLRLP
ncbi:hypothetical protein GALLN_00037 [Gallionellaceae bacterium]|nr:hypothetical protein GALLN_00037 [Gallionellaceae bacterium]